MHSALRIPWLRLTVHQYLEVLLHFLHNMIAHINGQHRGGWSTPISARSGLGAAVGVFLDTLFWEKIWGGKGSQVAADSTWSMLDSTHDLPTLTA